MIADGRIEKSKEAKGTFLLPSLVDLSLDGKLCLFDTKTTPGAATVNYRLTKGFSLWHPVPKAERSEYGESFNQVTLWNSAPSAASKASPCGSFAYEFRLFNTGFGARAFVKPQSRASQSNPAYASEGDFVPVHWSMGLRLQDGARSSECIANNYEEPYVRLDCHQVTDAMMTPMTIQVAGKIQGEGLTKKNRTARGPSHMALLQSSGPSFVRSTVVASSSSSTKKNSLQTQLVLVSRGEAPFEPSSEDTLGVVPSPIDSKTLTTPTTWHVVIFGGSLRQLVESSHLVPLMCDPPPSNKPAWIDSRWIPHGKLIRITKFTTKDSKAIIDWTKANNFPLVHFDAGWYGNEYDKKSSAKQVLASFADKLDMAKVAKYANDNGRRLCVYVNELALRDTPELTRIYSNWGVSGIKFGFVEVGDPRAMRILHQRIIAFGDAGLFVNVHDSYRPRGLTRTFPFLVTQEGVRGEERKPDALHHTILPFVRTLQGSADYTPRYLGGGSVTHNTQIDGAGVFQKAPMNHNTHILLLHYDCVNFSFVAVVAVVFQRSPLY